MNMFEMEAKNVLKEAVRNIMEVVNQEVIISVSRECLDKLEENESFAEVTKEGISREALRSGIVTAFNDLIRNLNLEKFNDSTTMELIRGTLHERLDLTSFTGEDIFDIMDSAGLFSEIYKPEFKKTVIFNRAIELVAQSGNISFNTAVKRAIADVETKDYITREFEKSNLFNRIASSINLIVEFYLEHETEFILAIMMKKK